MIDEFETGDSVMHWNFGSGIVLANPRGAADVPDEWKHDWQNVVMVQFWHLNNGVVWVQRADCDKVSQR